MDRSLGRLVADKLREAGAVTEKHDSHFSQTTPDIEWIEVIGAKGWVVLTKDKRIRHNPLERKAIIAAHLRVFTLSRGTMTGEQMARIFVNHRARMERIARKETPHFVGIVSEKSIQIIRLSSEAKSPAESPAEGEEG